MTPDQFAQALQSDGFDPAVTVTREPGGGLDEHTHPYEVRALILAGDIGIAVAGEERVYRPGDVFHLPAHTPHREWYGAEGVQYLAGRRPVG
ncbi:MAG: cupin domain-containing protein [Acidovorax sp.]|jgi:quercetin dioxygenase-like cupin family protein